MKIGIIGDIHWCRYSSILRQRGNKYSLRLENCIESIKWAEELTQSCDYTVYLGDFFDSSELNSEEITALKELNSVWSTYPRHFFLVGNHEMGINDLSHSSSHMFEFINMTHSIVVDRPCQIKMGDVSLRFIPYVLEDNRLPLSEYFYDDNAEKVIMFSHNDIAGVQMGKFISKNGFTKEEIQDNCDLFFNGHLHNGNKIAEGIINVGNLTGQNFSEDAFVYDHCAMILDTDTMKVAVYENPHAINFYKIDTTEKSFDINSIKSNSVITMKVRDGEQNTYKEILDSNHNIIANRIIIAPSVSKSDDNIKEILSINHLDKFSEYVLTTLGTSDIVKQELEEVLK